MSHLLSNILVVDLGMAVAGPFASVPLVDLGADVIKIEPVGGEIGRPVWRPFASNNRGKRAMVLNLKEEDGQRIGRTICNKADVVIHNFRPGVIERLGLGYETLSKENPRLIMMSNSAYGETGPMAKHPGFDMLLQALAGHEHMNAGEGNPPLWLRWAPIDIATGYLGAIGILSALYRRQKTGKGSIVNTNLLNSANFMLSELIRNSDGHFEGVEKVNADQTGAHPARCLYETKDGWIAIVAQSDTQALGLADALDINELKNLTLEHWGDKEHSLIARRTKEYSSVDLLSILRSHGVWAEPCRENMEQELFQNDWRQSGLLREYHHPINGNIHLIGHTTRYSRTKLAYETTGRVPELGEHTREILQQFGYNPQEIERFYADGIVA